MTKLDTVFVTDIPSPHQVELFDEAYRSGLALGVIYIRHRDPSRLWRSRAIAHPHLFVDSCAHDCRQGKSWILDAGLSVIAGYSHPLQRQWMKARESARLPWCFWGERPGFRTRSWIGMFYRKLRLKTLGCSNAPIWGIGKWGVDGYREEFGCERSYFNVPYFSDLKRFQLSRNESLQNISGRTFLFSGQMIERKGIVELSEAFLRIALHRRDIRLRLLGAGPLLPRIKEDLKSVANQVDYLGFQDWESLPSIYRSSHIVIVPSRYDGWGMFVPEAMAAGCPVITTNMTGAAHDLILEGRNGWTVPPCSPNRLTDAIMNAANLDERELGEMSAAAVRSAERVEVSRGVSVLMDAINRTISAYESSSG